MQKWEELAYARDDGKTEGLIEGEAKGIAKGEVLKLISLVCKKLAKGKNAQAIAEALEENFPEVERICQAAEAYAPEYDCEKIYEELRENESAEK